MTETRKIAVILAADIVGFSRLTSADEDRTLARLRTLRSELIDPAVVSQNGRVFKRTGDGALVEFRSVVEAVRFAITIQNAMIERNVGMPPGQHIDFRIGIHLSDVVEESDGDLMGDGVNIAARLEGIANPGAICLSEDAFRQLKGRLDLAITDLGPIQLKNIAEPVRAYSLQVYVPAQAKPAPPIEPNVEEKRSVGLALPDKPSIAVLPFQNMSGDPEQDYFADGIVEEIITGLSRIKWLFVISRNSTFIYKGKPIDVKAVGRELGVRYVLEGSVRRSGNQLRVTWQLIESEIARQVWADRYDGTLGDIFALQNEITISVLAPSSRCCARPKSSALGANGPTTWMPTICCYAPSHSQQPECRKARTKRCRCLKRRSGWSRTTPLPTGSSPGAMNSDISVGACTPKRGRPPASMPRPRSQPAATMRWRWRWELLSLPWSKGITLLLLMLSTVRSSLVHHRRSRSGSVL